MIISLSTISRLGEFSQKEAKKKKWKLAGTRLVTLDIGKLSCLVLFCGVPGGHHRLGVDRFSYSYTRWASSLGPGPLQMGPGIGWKNKHGGSWRLRRPSNLAECSCCVWDRCRVVGVPTACLSQPATPVSAPDTICWTLGGLGKRPRGSRDLLWDVSVGLYQTGFSTKNINVTVSHTCGIWLRLHTFYLNGVIAIYPYYVSERCYAAYRTSCVCLRWGNSALLKFNQEKTVFSIPLTYLEHNWYLQKRWEITWKQTYNSINKTTYTTTKTTATTIATTLDKKGFHKVSPKPLSPETSGFWYRNLEQRLKLSPRNKNTRRKEIIIQNEWGVLNNITN